MPLLLVASIVTLCALSNMNNWMERSGYGEFSGREATISQSCLTRNNGCRNITLWTNFGVIMKVEGPYVSVTLLIITTKLKILINRWCS